MKKLNIILAGLICVTSIIPCYSFTNSISYLSTDETITAIWKMNLEDICSLHKSVFARECSDKKVTSNCINKAIDKTQACISSIHKAVREKIFGKTIITRILDTLKSVTLMEQEIIKEAIVGSYKEYELQLNSAEILFVALFLPIGIFYMYQKHKEHIQKIEAKRAGMSVQDFVTT